MAAVTTTIRNAIVAALNAAVAEPDAVYPAADAPFRFGFEAAGAFLIDLDLAGGFTGLTVLVVATAVKSATADRDTDGDTVTVEIGILQRFERSSLQAANFSQVGDLVEFAENVRDWLRSNPIEGAELHPLDNIELSPLYDHDRLLKDSLFASVIKVPVLAQFES